MHQDRLLTPAFVAVFAANLINGLSFFLFVHLPGFLTDIGADADQSYFSDGITEDIITDLSKVSGLFVVSRGSSFP